MKAWEHGKCLFNFIILIHCVLDNFLLFSFLFLNFNENLTEDTEWVLKVHVWYRKTGSGPIIKSDTVPTTLLDKFWCFGKAIRCLWPCKNFSISLQKLMYYQKKKMFLWSHNETVKQD